MDTNLDLSRPAASPPDALPLDVLEASGLGRSELERWAGLERQAPTGAELDSALAAVSPFLSAGDELLLRLPPPGRRTESEQHAAASIVSALSAARSKAAAQVAEPLYERVTRGFSRPLRLAELLDEAAALTDGLLPHTDLLARDRQVSLATKDGYERDQASLLAAVLAAPRCGLHLADSMRRPRAEAYELLDRFRREQEVDLGLAHVRREGRIGFLELRNAGFLNAEDDDTLPATEIAADLVLLDPDAAVGVLRGGLVSHPRYRGRRVFSAGLNLKALASGRLSFLFFVERDLGLVAKLYHGLSSAPGDDAPGETPWIGVVEAFAIGGGTQLLLVMDHVVSERNAFFSLPATNEGFIPGAAPLRLPRAVGPRLARELMHFGRTIQATDGDARLFADTVVEADELDAAVKRAADGLLAPGRVSITANRRALREGEEPLDAFVRYCALYVQEQASCMFSPELARKLEQHWLR